MWNRVAALALVVLLASCGGPAGQERERGGQQETRPGMSVTTTATNGPDHDPRELAGTRWSLRSLNNHGLAGGTEITLRIQGGALRGNGGCNSYSADRLRTEGGAFRVGPVTATQIGCKGPAGEQESEYLKTLQAAETYRATDDRLEILGGSGETTLVFEKENG